MEPNSANFLFWMMLLTFFWIGLFVIPQLMLRRAVFEVLNIFRQSHSLCSESPKTVDELGLTSQSLTVGLFKPRDYKPYALQILIKSGMVRHTEEDKMCLWDDRISEFQENRPL